MSDQILAQSVFWMDWLTDSSFCVQYLYTYLSALLICCFSFLAHRLPPILYRPFGLSPYCICFLLIWVRCMWGLPCLFLITLLILFRQCLNPGGFLSVDSMNSIVYINCDYIPKPSSLMNIYETSSITSLSIVMENLILAPHGVYLQVSI